MGLLNNLINVNCCCCQLVVSATVAVALHNVLISLEVLVVLLNTAADNLLLALRSKAGGRFEAHT